MSSQLSSTTYDLCQRVTLFSRLFVIVPTNATMVAFTSAFSRLTPTAFFKSNHSHQLFIRPLISSPIPQHSAALSSQSVVPVVPACKVVNEPLFRCSETDSGAVDHVPVGGNATTRSLPPSMLRVPISQMSRGCSTLTSSQILSILDQTDHPPFLSSNPPSHTFQYHLPAGVVSPLMYSTILPHPRAFLCHHPYPFTPNLNVAVAV